MAKAPKTWKPIDHAFTGTITAEGEDRGAWQCIHVPGSKEIVGTGNPVKVKGTLDGHPYEVTMMPNGKGAHMFPVRADTRKSLGKEVGDTVDVELSECFT